MEHIFAVVKDGHIMIMRPNGQWRNTIHSNGGSERFVSAQVNGDVIMGVCADGRCNLYDINGCYKGVACQEILYE